VFASKFPMLRACVFAALLVAPLAGAVPVVNVRLSQPPAPLPEVSAEIAALEASRASAEASGIKRLDAAFEGAVRDAERRIKAVLASAGRSGARIPVSLLSAPAGRRAAEHAGLRLRVLPARPASNGVQKKIAAVERVRSSEEQLLIDQGVRELGLLVDIVTAQLRAGLSPAAAEQRVRASAFLGSSLAARQGVDVRLLPPDAPFTTIGDLVAEMEGRRDAAENQLRRHIVELELKLLQRMKGVVSAALG
jgi:hypothetical protein